MLAVRILLAFDQDAKPSTRHTVALAIRRFSATYCDASWQRDQHRPVAASARAKGVDDLIVVAGERLHGIKPMTVLPCPLSTGRLPNG